MANGYIGKISAVVTANTSDLSRKLQGAVGDVDKFANRIAASIERSSKNAADSLNNIFTPLQRLQRNIQAGLAGNVFRRDNVQQYVRSVQQAVSISEQLGKPLASGASQFQKLSLEVQGAFLPALNRAQTAVIDLSATLQQQGSISERSFGQVEGVVNRTTQAIQRLTQAQQLAAQSFTGNELQFGNPRLFETLTANARITQQAAALPASALVDGDIARQLRALDQYQKAAVEAEARVESLRLEPNVSPEVVLAAERRLQSLIETARRAGIEIEKAIKAASPSAAIARANARLTIAPDQPPPPSPSTPLGNRNAQAGAERIRGLTGNLNIDSTPVPGVFNQQAQRDIDALAGRVGQVRQQLETLPNSVRTQFIPALQQAASQLTALQNSPAATAEQIERAAASVKKLEDRAKRTAAALALPTFAEFSENFSSQRAVGELQALQQVLTRVGATAAGPAAQAYDKYRARLQSAVAEGTTGLPRVRAELEKLQVEAAKAAAATGRISFKSALQDIRRGGDIARGGADRFTLGFQQALFAVDDFFSVTGDLQQRIRAVGNNLTQLGFIVGGTKGLFVSLGAVLGLQLVSAFLKVRNGGRELEDQTRSLTNALQEQKRALDAILQSFDQVAGDIADRGLTTATKRAEELAKRLREIAREQEKLQRNRLVELDPEVQERRSNQATLQRRLEQSRRPAERVAMQSLIDRERQLELEAADRAFAGRGDGGAAFARRQAEQITAILERQRYFQILAEENNSFSSPAAVRRRAAEQAGLAFDGVDFADRRAVRAAAVRERERLAELAARPDDFIGNALAFADQAAFPEAQEAVGALELFIRRLDATAEVEKFTQSIVKAANSIDSSLPETLTRLEQAAEANVGGAKARIQSLEELSLDLQRQVELAKNAFKRFAEGDEGAGADARAARDRAVAIVQAIEAEQKKAAVLDSVRRSLETFSAALDRISTELANTVAQEARGLADQARRDANREQGIVDAGLGGRRGDADAAAQRRDRLAREAAEFERRAAQIAADNARARIGFERQAAAGGLGREAKDLIRQRDRAQAIIDNQASPAAAVINAQATLDVINTELQQIFEQSGAGQAAARLADELNKAAAAAARRDELIQRGRELDLSPAEQSGRELAEEIRAIQERLAADLPDGFDGRIAGVIAAEGGDRLRRELGLIRDDADADDLRAAGLLEDAAADIARVREERFRQEAPAIFALADQVQNAILQGPSRAALEATDVSTVEGARELNRLLRGDDAARDQNLVELQKQSQILERIARGVEDPAQVAN